ncbi:AarF/UbiB family protein [Marivirga atlantica]|jgi:predicted unusual protein kinase regulating ubiquinone biosynthesis (AarF/ABC1/UbiB family)|uniref:AarF/ABC1/UbiB kinase family protein n=1 Tax=Marivirga atlantica TaxID=1548457 RepID=A0A937AD57_9BACT|nr:AarF/ABC1/UbiB kinase family protein [Marivirga atlantica]MBL0766635.1 AarF/ABC1/UbiB kinase family protein [Marivirga atlantica]
MAEKKEQKRIPVSKIQRASKFVSTGAKVGGNYVKYYTKKAFNRDLDRSELDNDNAEDIYESLSQLKGSALKVAQMLSMDKNLLPPAYQERFTMSQYSAPPLSYPLVVKTFKKEFGKGPEEMFDTFTKKAVNAASMGQVHQATIGDKKYAVKIQYPGVADSISSDLRLVRPFATRLFNMSNAELDHYMSEVEGKLMEEADYCLELDRSQEITEAIGDSIEGLFFPKYYKEMSGDRVITMDWLDGKHMKEFLKDEPSQEIRNKIGQALWDFYDFQFHQLKQVHADPHPGNFLLNDKGEMGIIDFGCVKEIPEDFYENYFSLLKPGFLQDKEEIDKRFTALDFFHEKDTPAERKIFNEVFLEMIGMLSKPFQYDSFDFGDDSFFEAIYAMGEKVSNMKEVRNSNGARGSRHGLYVNRTYFGLYNMLNQLGAKVDIRKPDWLKGKTEQVA